MQLQQLGEVDELRLRFQLGESLRSSQIWEVAKASSSAEEFKLYYGAERKFGGPRWYLDQFALETESPTIMDMPWWSAVVELDLVGTVVLMLKHGEKRDELLKLTLEHGMILPAKLGEVPIVFGHDASKKLLDAVLGGNFSRATRNSNSHFPQDVCEFLDGLSLETNSTIMDGALSQISHEGLERLCFRGETYSIGGAYHDCATVMWGTRGIEEDHFEIDWEDSVWEWFDEEESPPGDPRSADLIRVHEAIDLYGETGQVTPLLLLANGQVLAEGSAQGVIESIENLARLHEAVQSEYDDLKSLMEYELEYRLESIVEEHSPDEWVANVEGRDFTHLGDYATASKVYTNQAILEETGQSTLPQAADWIWRNWENSEHQLTVRKILDATGWLPQGQI